MYKINSNYIRFNLNEDKSTSEMNKRDITHNDKIPECDCSQYVNKEGLSSDFS